MQQFGLPTIRPESNRKGDQCRSARDVGQPIRRKQPGVGTAARPWASPVSCAAIRLPSIFPLVSMARPAVRVPCAGNQTGCCVAATMTSNGTGGKPLANPSSPVSTVRTAVRGRSSPAPTGAPAVNTTRDGRDEGGSLGSVRAGEGGGRRASSRSGISVGSRQPPAHRRRSARPRCRSRTFWL